MMLARRRTALRRACGLAAAAVLATAPAAAQQAADALEGRWEGLLGTGAEASAFAFTLAVTATGWSGTFDVPAENSLQIPLAGIRIRGDSLVLTLRDGQAAILLRGVLAGDSITGLILFPQGERPVLLGRPASAVARRAAALVAEAVAAARNRPLEAGRTGDAVGRVDDAALVRLLRAAEAANSDAIVVLHDGELVGAWYAGGERRRIEAMSATKSIVNLAVGRLVTQGIIPSIDAPVHSFFPEWNEGLKASVTIRHLLNHTSGLHADRTTEAIYASADVVRHALDGDIVSAPGTMFFYNNSATNLLAGVIGKAAGKPMDVYLRDALFEPLGIRDFTWSRDRAGNPHGMAGLQIQPEDLARLGQLVLDRGRADGEQLIRESWFDQSLRPGSEHRPGVGLLWWLIRDVDPEAGGFGSVTGYRADGYLGQYLVVYPAERLVAVRMVVGSAAYDPTTDTFPDFQSLVRQLVPKQPQLQPR
jgi:CubicO group peptidase (beta-lactamase class C family)